MTGKIRQLYDEIQQGDRSSLGRGLTLVESEHPSDREKAIELLSYCEQKLKTVDPSVRLAVSGAPGVGKSTLIDAVGMMAVSRGSKVGVLTVDPSSMISHGSVLGDKSRMVRLSVNKDAFIRSSPAGHILGGLGRRSMELMTMLAAAGYDLILLETVGVGQSEHIAWQITDGFILVVQPGAGDELQGIKRGITELADIVIINKADGDLLQLAKKAKSQFETALHFLRSTREHWMPKVGACSALDGTGLENIWDILRLFMEDNALHTNKAEARLHQEKYWLTWSLQQTASHLLMENTLIQGQLRDAVASVNEGRGSTFTYEWQIEKEMRSFIGQHHSKAKAE